MIPREQHRLIPSHACRKSGEKGRETSLVSEGKRGMEMGGGGGGDRSKEKEKCMSGGNEEWRTKLG